MKSYGADMSVCDYDRRTPLHVAASEGDVEMVKYLMKVKFTHLTTIKKLWVCNLF